MVECIGLRAALSLADRLPLRAVTALAGSAGSLWYGLDVARRRTACENIRRSGIAATEAEIRRIARASFRHFGILAVESLKASAAIRADNWRDFVQMDIPKSSFDLLAAPGQGLILVSGHLGNWEVAAQIVSFLKPVVGVTRRMNNPHTEAIIHERKERDRFVLTPKHDADAFRFISALRSGHVLALLIDQHARTRGMMIPFLGTPASAHTSPALLHLVTRAPLCFGYCLRTGPLNYRFVATEPIVVKPTGNREADVRLILERLTRELEAAIRSAPDQYVWAHRRWRAPTQRASPDASLAAR